MAGIARNSGFVNNDTMTVGSGAFGEGAVYVSAPAARGATAPPGLASADAGDSPARARPPAGHAGHAFISYVREDSRRASKLQRVLEAANVPVWRDTRSLWPGEDWRIRIRRAITDDALVFLACFSRASMAKDKSHQNEELTLAIEQIRLRRPDLPWLIPVRFDDCPIPDLDIGAGRMLTSIQRVDLFGQRGDEGIARLTTMVLRMLHRTR